MAQLKVSEKRADEKAVDDRARIAKGVEDVCIFECFFKLSYTQLAAIAWMCETLDTILEL